MSYPQNYLTPADISSMDGYRAEDMLSMGYEMNTPEYMQFLEYVCSAVTEIANRWCNVSTYHLHTIAEEYHTMDTSDFFTASYGVRAPYLFFSDPVAKKSQLMEWSIYPREYPVKSVEEVWINTRRDDQLPAWRLLHTVPAFDPLNPNPEPIDGVCEYKFLDDGFDMKHILLTKWLPMVGTNNIRIVYSAGFEEDNPIFSHLRTACILMAQNILAYKKKLQEAATIRGSGIPDYAQMFALRDESMILTQSVKDILNLVKRQPLAVGMYH